MLHIPRWPQAIPLRHCRLCFTRTAWPSAWPPRTGAPWPPCARAWRRSWGPSSRWGPSRRAACWRWTRLGSDAKRDLFCFFVCLLLFLVCVCVFNDSNFCRTGSGRYGFPRLRFCGCEAHWSFTVAVVSERVINLKVSVGVRGRTGLDKGSVGSRLLGAMVV